MYQKESYVSYDGGVLWSCESGSSNALPVFLCSGGPGCCDYLESVAKIEVIKGASRYIWLDKAEELGVAFSDFLLSIKELY